MDARDLVIARARESGSTVRVVGARYHGGVAHVHRSVHRCCTCCSACVCECRTGGGARASRVCEREYTPWRILAQKLQVRAWDARKCRTSAKTAALLGPTPKFAMTFVHATMRKDASKSLLACPNERISAHANSIGTSSRVSWWRLKRIKHDVMRDALVLFEMGQDDAALDGFAHSLAIEQSMRWRDYSFTASIEHNIGACLHGAGKLCAAQRMRLGARTAAPSPRSRVACSLRA